MINLIARLINGLAITTLELTAASFVVVMLGTSYFWLHKPGDVSRPFIISCLSSIAQIRAEVGCQIARRQRYPIDHLLGRPS